MHACKEARKNEIKKTQNCKSNLANFPTRFFNENLPVCTTFCADYDSEKKNWNILSFKIQKSL